MPHSPPSPDLVQATPLPDPFVTHRARGVSESDGSMRTPPDSPRSVASAPASFSEPSIASATHSAAASSSPPAPSSQATAGTTISATEYSERLRCHQRAFDIAQMVCPADATIFVGNLPATLNDLELSDNLLEIFSTYGACCVSVRRHYSPHHVKPYAYVQFSSREEASACLGGSEDTFMRGRLLRVDASNACRHILVLHVDNTFVNNYEAYGVFGHFGTVDHIAHDNNTGGTIIRFLNYGCFLAAQHAVRRNNLFGYKLL